MKALGESDDVSVLVFVLVLGVGICDVLLELLEENGDYLGTHIDESLVEKQTHFIIMMHLVQNLINLRVFLNMLIYVLFYLSNTLTLFTQTHQTRKSQNLFLLLILLRLLLTLFLSSLLLLILHTYHSPHF